MIAYYVSETMSDVAEKFGWPQFYDGGMVIDAISNPSCKLVGLQRQGYEDGICFAVKPEKFGDGSPNDVGAVLVVFAECFEEYYVVLDWDLRKECSKNPGYPANWENDFEGVIR